MPAGTVRTRVAGGRGESGGSGREFSSRLRPPRGGRAPAVLAWAALAGIVAWWSWRAFHDPLGYDFRLAYEGGQVAWSTGHPEHQSTWTGTPLLAALMGFVSRLWSLRTASDLITALNLVLVIAVVAVVLRSLRDRLSHAWWWVTAFALLSFGPVMSTVWWKQFNIIAIVLALTGFELLRRRRPHPAAALIGLSISIKPLIFLLPLVLLARRETRRVGALAIGWVVALNLAAQALLAARAHDIAAISPIFAIRNFVEKSKPGNVWACQSENFAPGSLLCRLAGHRDWTLQRIAVWVAVGLLGVFVIRALGGLRARGLRARGASAVGGRGAGALRGSGASGWELFAFVAALSVMVSPLAWTHYQIMLAPLLVLLLVRFTEEGAGPVLWAGLAGAFVLASLMWQPYGTVVSAAGGLVGDGPRTVAQKYAQANIVAWVAQFSQYLLVVTGAVWYARSRRHAAPPLLSSR